MICYLFVPTGSEYRSQGNEIWILHGAGFWSPVLPMQLHSHRVFLLHRFASSSLGPPSLRYNGYSRQLAGIKTAGEWNLLRIHKAYPYRRPLLFWDVRQRRVVVRLPIFWENLSVPSAMVKRLEDGTNRLSETSETTNLSWHPRKAKSSFTQRWKPYNTHSFPVVEQTFTRRRV